MHTQYKFRLKVCQYSRVPAKAGGTPARSDDCWRVDTGQLSLHFPSLLCELKASLQPLLGSGHPAL